MAQSEDSSQPDAISSPSFILLRVGRLRALRNLPLGLRKSQDDLMVNAAEALNRLGMDENDLVSAVIFMYSELSFPPDAMGSALPIGRL